MKQVIDLAGRAGALLTPPPSEDAAVRMWRWIVVISIAGNSAGLVIVTMLAFGMLPWAFPGFASAQDQHHAQTQIIETRVEQLEWRMFELRIKQCEAISRDENPRIYTIQLEQLFRTYRTLNREPPALPACRELG